MNIKPIKTPADHRAALKEIESLMAAKADTPEGGRLDVLVTLIEACEQRHFPMDLPDPVEAIKFRMEQSGLTSKDLEPMIGPASDVADILGHKRPLTGRAKRQSRRRRSRQPIRRAATGTECETESPGDRARR